MPSRRPPLPIATTSASLGAFVAIGVLRHLGSISDASTADAWPSCVDGAAHERGGGATHLSLTEGAEGSRRGGDSVAVFVGRA